MYESHWEQTESAIVQVWSLVDAPEEPVPGKPLEELVAEQKQQIEMLTECLMEMSELVYQ